MNPFDLPGPQFLVFYGVSFAAALVMAILWRRSLRGPRDELSAQELDLSPYEVAYLAGGGERVVEAILGRLVHEKALKLGHISRELIAVADQPPSDLSSLERTVYDSALAEKEDAVRVLHGQAEQLMGSLRPRLEHLGLLLTEDQARAARWLPTGLVLLVPLLGVIKIGVGVSRGRPVLFLVLACIASVIAAFAFFGRSVRRSRRGDRALARLREDNAAIEFQAGRRATELSGQDLALALGLFGTGILVAGPLKHVEAAFKAPVPSGGRHESGSASCGAAGCGGGGGCGGGCGGGGCGGCGG